jgi:oxygen-independent coproporphyrinogen-3 oxidase
LGRVHSAERAFDRLQAAVNTGLEVSADLMCAIPAQTDQSWARTVKRAISSGIVHVSVYPLQIEEGTPFDRLYGDAEATWNDTDVQARRMELAGRILATQGFTRYEVASYALGGRECRHNEAYWTARPYLGLGTNASSMLTREGYERLRKAAHQLPGLPPDASRVRLTCTDGRREIAEARGLSELHFDLEPMSEAQAAAEDFCRVSFEEDAPEPVRLACLLFVSYHYENRDIPDMTTYKSMRMAFEHLLYPHRDPAQMF